MIAEVKKKHESKYGPFGWRSGPSKVGLKIAKQPHLCRHSQRTPNPKKRLFFKIKTSRLPESVKGLNTSLAQSAGELWPKKYRSS